MKLFLEILAKHLVEKSAGALSNHCFVFPNRRSGLFFKRYLVRHIPGITWAPEIVTINELMSGLSGLETSDPLDLLFDIYGIYEQVAARPEAFDEFYPWGEMMISDFDTLDKYLVDPGAIFRNIRELKEIDEAFGGLDEEQVAFIRKFWRSFHQGDPTREKDVFLSTWSLMPKIYHGLNEVLDQRDEGYEGKIYRRVAETAVEQLNDKIQGRHYAFVGFNALSASEKQLFRKLKKRGVASFYWDYDELYFSDESMEAGRFLRENMEEFPQEEGLDAFDSRGHDRKIRIFDLPSDILQAKTVNRILSERGNPIEEASDTAIIACDENLLMPILYSLPPQVDLVNVTMGYPFTNTPLFSFVESILRLYRHAGKDTRGKTRYYNRDVLSVLNHQYFKMISGRDPRSLVEKITRENRVYLHPGFFEQDPERMIFDEVSTPAGLIEVLNAILRYMLTRLVDEDNHTFRELEREYVLVMMSRLNKLARITGGKSGVEMNTFMRLFRRVIAGLRIPFTGEPLAGLQLMGILETRLLDFENVIMLSVNEDVMPDTSSGFSFIPYSMRIAYGLPTREEMDAIYAYYFYRVIQRAEKVDLLYKGATDGVRSGEMSRYLYQAYYDLGAEIIRPVMPVSSSAGRSITIQKRPEVMAGLDQYLEGNEDDRYLSPSSLNTYIECPLRFYFRKIAKIREQEELLEEVDAIGFGNILHHTIHQLYDGIATRGETATKKDFETLLDGDLLDNTLTANFMKEFFGSDRNREIEGRNLVILAIIRKYLVKIIQKDAEEAPLQLISLEENLVITREISVGEKNLKVRIGGLIDRVDRPQGGITRIIDYKTGKASRSFNSIEALFDGENVNRNKQAFQALVYALLYLEDHPEESLMPGLYVVRDLFGVKYTPHFEIGESRKKEPLLSFNEFSDPFDQLLKGVLEEIYDPAVPFRQTEVTDHCSYCDFKAICDR